MKKILLVEDDSSLGETLSDRLTSEGYELHWAQTLASASDLFKQKTFDLILLDVGLPDGSGFTLAREIKEKSYTPIIFLTAMTSAEYRLEGYEIGAEDYIPKPFHLKELLLRIGKVIGEAAQKDLLQSGPVTLNRSSLSFVCNGAERRLSSQRDFDLIWYLIEQAPKVINRSEILLKVFRADPETTQRTVDNSIVRIREALGNEFEMHLRSVRGVGYQWVS